MISFKTAPNWLYIKYKFITNLLRFASGLTHLAIHIATIQGNKTVI